MLEALRRKFSRGRAIGCRVGDAEKLPLGDHAADYCFANMLLHHVEAPLPVIREMARIVRPGGRVVVTDLDAHDHAFLRVEHHDRWMGFAREDIRRWFHEAGLTHIRSENAGESWERLEGYRFKWGQKAVPDVRHPGMLFLTTYGGSVFYGPAEGIPGAFEDIENMPEGWW